MPSRAAWDRSEPEQYVVALQPWALAEKAEGQGPGALGLGSPWHHHPQGFTTNGLCEPVLERCSRCREDTLLVGPPVSAGIQVSREDT